MARNYPAQCATVSAEYLWRACCAAIHCGWVTMDPVCGAIGDVAPNPRSDLPVHH